MTENELARWLRPLPSPLGWSQAADLSVAQAPVDEGEKLAGRGHDTDLAATALGDAVVVNLELGAAPLPLDSLDGSPAHQAAALFGDVAPLDGRIRLPVAGDEPGPGGQAVGAAEAVNVADLGHEDGPQHRAHPGDPLDHPVAIVISEAAGDVALEHLHLLVVGLDEVPQRLHPSLIGRLLGITVSNKA